MDQNAGSNNVINNYKGVMLCSRPNEVQNTTVEKPFCGRVVNRHQLGLVPTKQQKIQTYQGNKKPRLQILDRHKKWLQHFKKQVGQKKNQVQQNKKQQQQKMKKIRQQAQADRQRSRKMKQQYNQTATDVMNILDDKQAPKITSNQITSQNLQKLNLINQVNQKSAKDFKKKKASSKPLWAQTQQQVEQHQNEQVDELLNFFQDNHVEDYAQDQQVQSILNNLKQKIHQLKDQQDWKNKQIQRINHRKQQKKQNNQSDQDDKKTNFSHQSEGRSVASERTQQKIQQLQARKKQQQQWDKFSTSQKSSIAGIDQKIAKNIADEVLRNYPNMRGVHSNVSIRKLLQAEAAKFMNQPIARPVITTIVKQKQKIDANNLPYLHRNPAI